MLVNHFIDLSFVRFTVLSPDENKTMAKVYYTLSKKLFSK